MLFGSAKPTVTSEDKEWIEDVFLWFEEQYSKDYLKNVVMLEPTKEFFPVDFKGTEENARQLTDIICDYMQIRNVEIDLHYFSSKPIELTDGISITQHQDRVSQSSKTILGTYQESGANRYSIGIERDLLKDPVFLIGTLAHELSHLVLLGEHRLEENDEELTDLNAIALGFGIFIANSIFTFQQWHGSSHHGWQAQTRGYIPEQVASYALALLTNYQNKNDLKWTEHLNRSVRKMFEKNMSYLKETADIIRFK